jgi:ribosomal 50S subunit-associated protein YjgA (DUF615 family)
LNNSEQQSKLEIERVKAEGKEAIEVKVREGADKVKAEKDKEIHAVKEDMKRQVEALQKVIGEQESLKDDEVNKYDLKGLSLIDALRKLIKQVDQSKSQNSDQITALNKEIENWK